MRHSYLNLTNSLKIFFCTIGTAAWLLGCTHHSQSPPAFTKVDNKTQSENITKSVATDTLSEADMQVETTVSDGCVKAWRRALAGDEAGAMAQLHKLDKEYPNCLTTRFMMGQIMERAGKKKEAVRYYREAAVGSEFSSIHIFKLAEALRTSGDGKAAVIEYRRLLKLAPDFPEGKLGLAKSLLTIDKKSTEAREEIKDVLKTDPNNTEARALLHQLSALEQRHI